MTLTTAQLDRADCDDAEDEYDPVESAQADEDYWNQCAGGAPAALDHDQPAGRHDRGGCLGSYR